MTALLVGTVPPGTALSSLFALSLALSRGESLLAGVVFHAAWGNARDRPGDCWMRLALVAQMPPWMLTLLPRRSTSGPVRVPRQGASPQVRGAGSGRARRH